MHSSFLHYRLEIAQHLVKRKKIVEQNIFNEQGQKKFHETELQVNSLSEQLLSITYILHMEVSRMTNSTNSTETHMEYFHCLFFIFRFSCIFRLAASLLLLVVYDP